jgi:four helix bundle protein
MSDSSTGPRPHAPTDDCGLDAERLEVYQLALEFQALVVASRFRGQPALRDQLERASMSIALNIAEGAGRRLPADKARFYGIARGSAMECAAAFDIIRLRRLVSDDECRRARGLLVRIVQMASKLESVVLSRAQR